MAFTVLIRRALVYQFTSKTVNAFSVFSNQYRYFSHNSNKDFIPFKSPNAKSDEDEILEIYDLPPEDHFREDPTFEYVSQDKKERLYDFISPTRSTSGVFDLKEIVQFLRVENFKDIVAIRLPESAHYAEYMVIASAKTKRHLATTASVLQKLYKMKRCPTDSMPPFEGLKEKSDWVAVDLGNIILHLFSSTSCRSTYDLESLWSAGHEFDEQAQGLGNDQLKGAEQSASFFNYLSQSDWEAIVAEVQAEQQTTKYPKPDKS